MRDYDSIAPDAAPSAAPEGFWSGKAAPVDAIAADFAQAGAFALTPGSGDSAVKLALPPGTYIEQPSSLTGEQGTALIEVHDVPMGPRWLGDHMPSGEL